MNKLIALSLLVASFSASAGYLFRGVDVGVPVLVAKQGSYEVIVSKKDCSIRGEAVSNAEINIFMEDKHARGCVVVKDNIPYAVIEAGEEIKVFSLENVKFAKVQEL